MGIFVKLELPVGLSICQFIYPLLLSAGIPPLEGPGRPSNLRCEYRVNPLGLEVGRPRLSWQVNDPRRGAVQTAYQVIIESDGSAKVGGAPLWDSGKTRSDACSQVPYGGPTLLSGQRCTWRVRTWDRQDRPSEFSEPAWWEMGLLEPKDWQARWMTREPTADAGEIDWGDWIWSPAEDQREVFSRRVFEVSDPGRVESAFVTLTVDDSFVLHVNGRERGRSGNSRIGHTFDLREDLRPGRNVIAVEMRDSDGVCGLLAAGRIVAANQPVDLRSDVHWCVSPKTSPGWQQPEFDDASWPRARVVAPYGGGPWNQIKVAAGERESICLRRELTITGEVKRARIYASGLGLYELRLDGRRVGSQALAPNWTDYSRRVEYQTFDVTPQLRPGRHALGAVLGNGWWAMTLGWASHTRQEREEPRFILQLDIEYVDGSRQRCVTDHSWRIHPSPIRRNSIYDGEEYDARLEAEKWDQTGFDDSGWERARVCDDPVNLLVAASCEPIEVTQELRAVSVTHPSADAHVFDFGQNMAGRARLQVNGPRGTRIQLAFGELLGTDGHIYRGNLRGARATDVYILRGGGPEVWEPRFTYHGFRYCEVTGYPGTPAPESLVALALHSAVEQIGRFECSNALLNTIFRNMLWTQRSNLFGLLTDCCQRDERLGWTGDTQLFAATACWNMQMGPLLAKWMRDVRDAQGSDGCVPDVVPSLGERKAGKPGWGDACIIVPWTVYRMYGDTRIIEDNYTAMAAWLDYLRGHSRDDLCRLDTFGDWVAPAASPKAPLANAYCYHSHRLMAEMAGVIGRSEDARRFAARADRIAAAFNRAYWDSDRSSYAGRTQTANLLPLWFGLVPDDRRAMLLDQIAADVRGHGDHLTTGFVGSAYLLPALAAGGHEEVAYALATQTNCPSWGYMVKQGATTFWERWDSDRLGPRMNSHNQPALASMGRWLYESLGGIQAETPGFRRITIRPQPAGDLTWARAEYLSPLGPIHSDWRRTADGLEWKVVVPPGATARLCVPTGREPRPTIHESPQCLVRAGRVEAATGNVRFVRIDASGSVFDVDSGEYHFRWQRTQAAPSSRPGKP